MFNTYVSVRTKVKFNTSTICVALASIVGADWNSEPIRILLSFGQSDPVLLPKPNWKQIFSSFTYFRFQIYRFEYE